MRATDVLSRSRPDGAVVIIKLSCDDRFFQLDNLAAELWYMLDGRKTVEALCSVLIAKYKAPATLARKEARRLICDLYKHELIECG